MKKVIIHATTAKMIVTARYMHIWHECLAMTNGKIMVRLKTETEHLCKRVIKYRIAYGTRVLYD